MAIAPRHVAVLGLLALGPVLAWALGGGSTSSVVLTGTNVVLIVASLALAMRSTAGEGRVHAP